jgi:hypothetical protein
MQDCLRNLTLLFESILHLEFEIYLYEDIDNLLLLLILEFDNLFDIEELDS